MLFTHLSLGLAPGTMDALSAASYLAGSPQDLQFRDRAQSLLFTGQGLHSQCLVGQALWDRNQGCRDTARTGKSLTLAQVAQASGVELWGFRGSWARTEMGLDRG